MSLRTAIRDGLNISLRPFGVQVIRSHSTDPAIKPFISARKTIAASRRAGIPVGEYIDRTYSKPGATDQTVKAILRLAELTGPVERVCEIGAGSGRYAEKIIDALHPMVYEAYEPKRDWQPHLRMLPNVVTPHCDGHTLAATESMSVDLVHADKVYVYLPFITVVEYLDEMTRVVRPGGVVAFDIVSERCLDEQTLEHWRQHGTIYLPVPRDWVIDRLGTRGLSFRGGCLVPLTEGRTELLVFRREN